MESRAIKDRMMHGGEIESSLIGVRDKLEQL